MSRDIFIPANGDEKKWSQLTEAPGWPGCSRDVFSHINTPLDVFQGSEYAPGIWAKCTNEKSINCVCNHKNTAIQGFLYRISE